jgi:tetratricopeptide (TPR) repeat protein
LAEAYIEKGLVQEAIGELETALKLRPQMNNVRTSLALMLVEQGQLDKAMYHYKKIIKGGSKNPAVYVGLARIYMEETSPRNKEAIRVLEQGNRKLPDDTTIAYHLAYLYVQEGINSSRVAELLAKVVKDTPDAEAARLELGKAYARLGKKAEAREQFEWLVDHSVDLRSQALEEISRLK